MACSFYYFGFGSNLLAKRLHIENPTADRIGPGKLQNYRLDFHTVTDRWFGAGATIVPSKGDHVWGAIWKLEGCDMKHLDNQKKIKFESHLKKCWKLSERAVGGHSSYDKSMLNSSLLRQICTTSGSKKNMFATFFVGQEGVHEGIYTPITVSVYCPTLDSTIECRAYHLCDQPETDIKLMPANEVPIERLPSATYLKALIKGALESEIPYEYIEWLMHLPHNANIAERFEKELELENVPLY
ncbi:gamma-glutamylcyclotransferase-like isoform X1 [Haematobia irritans]|uniref:gamma-glutamylcyclotransferase-like isoform X1 n=1 Tax=Haematobia irritans TaxID=7368 RepID=UPI003F501063